MFQEVQVCEASGQVERGPAQAREVAVTLIRAGESRNGYIYTAQVLQAAASLFEGATAFCDHGGFPGHPDSVRRGAAAEVGSGQCGGGRSVRDVVGSYRQARYDGDRISAVLRLVDGEMARLIEQVVRDREQGLPAPNIGLSADMVVALSPADNGRKVVERILRVNSVDVVFDPSAGGEFERILEGRMWRRTDSGTASRNTSQHRGGENVAEAHAIESTAGEAQVAERNARPAETDTRALQMALCGDLLTARLAAANLPEAARLRLAQQFVGRVFEASELESAIGDMRSLLGSLSGQMTVRGAGGARLQVGLGLRDRLQWATDRLLGLEIPESVRESVPHAGGVRELFQAAGFDGGLGWETRRITEANEVTTAVMANIVGVSINKRLVKDYAAQPKWWKAIAVETPVRDMKEQERIRLNDFASLSTVSENGAYTNLAWDDAKETYTPAKRGNIVYVTLETIINDDVRSVQSIPKKLARAAGVTINEFVAGLFTANAGEGSTMADTHHVFDAVNHQSNLGAAALDATSFGAAMAAIAKMSDTASQRMGLAGKWLLIPPDLEQAAFTLLYSQLKPGSDDNDANYFQGRAQYIVVPQFTDTNNWYLLADPAQIELIEIGYLGGQDTPELLVQDGPAAGTVFTNDAISYKVRWIFGGGWLDYRGAYGAVVA